MVSHAISLSLFLSLSVNRFLLRIIFTEIKGKQIENFKSVLKTWKKRIQKHNISIASFFLSIFAVFNDNFSHVLSLMAQYFSSFEKKTFTNIHFQY